MAKTFAMMVGWVLVIVGVLNFFVVPIKLMPVHAIVHIVAGLLGIWAAKSHAVAYAMWVGIVGVILAIFGIFVQNILGVLDFPAWITVIYFALSIWGIWTYWTASKKPSMGGTPMG